MNKIKLILPLLMVAPVIFACGSKNNLASSNYKLDDTVEQNFKFEDGITEQQFFNNTDYIFPVVPKKKDIIAQINKELCSNSREYLGWMSFSNQPDINAGYYSLNYKEYEEGAASTSAYAYKTNGDKVEFIESRSGGKINLWTFGEGSTFGGGYYCSDEIYVEPAKKENDKIVMNFTYIFTHQNFERTKTIKIANATFSMVYNKINI